jgi:hypothetical protein
MFDEINSIILIEVLGRPAEHVKEAINGLLEKLSNEKGVKIVSKKIHEPVPAKSHDKTSNLFISFMELDLTFQSLARLLEICFAYMPSSVEIVKPAELRIKLNDINVILNFLLSRLHQYDAVAKKLTIENMVMQKKLHELGVSEIDMKKEMFLI